MKDEQIKTFKRCKKNSKTVSNAKRNTAEI